MNRGICAINPIGRLYVWVLKTSDSCCLPHLRCESAGSPVLSFSARSIVVCMFVCMWENFVCLFVCLFVWLECQHPHAHPRPSYVIHVGHAYVHYSLPLVLYLCFIIPHLVVIPAILLGEFPKIPSPRKTSRTHTTLTNTSNLPPPPQIFSSPEH